MIKSNEIKHCTRDKNTIFQDRSSFMSSSWLASLHEESCVVCEIIFGMAFTRVTKAGSVSMK